MSDVELRELDCWIAQHLFNEKYPFVGDPWNDYVQRVNVICAKKCPHYSTDISAAMLVEDKILEMGLVGEYTLALADLLERPGWLLFDLIHASAEQRCLAAKSVIEKR